MREERKGGRKIGRGRGRELNEVFKSRCEAIKYGVG